MATTSWSGATQISFDDMEKFFRLPIAEASAQLGWFRLPSRFKTLVPRCTVPRCTPLHQRFEKLACLLAPAVLCVPGTPTLGSPSSSVAVPCRMFCPEVEFAVSSRCMKKCPHYLIPPGNCNMMHGAN